MAVDPIGPPPASARTEPTAVSRPPDSTAGAGRTSQEKLPAFNDPDGPGFSDLLDILNPLQHIPLVNTLYQHLTGDHEGAVADAAGGMLWGGPLGFCAAAADLVVRSETGKSISDNVIAFFSDDDQSTAVANAGQPAAAPAAEPESAPPEAAAAPAGQDAAAGALPQPSSTAADAAPSPMAAAGSGGPVVAGDYLIFGQAGSQPISLLPAGSTRRPPTDSVAAAAQRSPSRQMAQGMPQSLVPIDGGAGGRPRQVGDYLVFGSTGTAAPPPPAPPATGPETAGNRQEPARMALADNGQPQQAADFLVFGASQPAATALPSAASPPPLRPTPSSQAPAAAEETSSAAENQTRLHPLPPRRGPATPPAALPMATTGPAAVRGNVAAQAGTTWFPQVFNDAMDKYEKAARLGTKDGMQPTSQSPAAAPTY